MVRLDGAVVEVPCVTCWEASDDPSYGYAGGTEVIIGRRTLARATALDGVLPLIIAEKTQPALLGATSRS